MLESGNISHILAALNIIFGTIMLFKTEIFPVNVNLLMTCSDDLLNFVMLIF